MHKEDIRLKTMSKLFIVFVLIGVFFFILQQSLNHKMNKEVESLVCEVKNILENKVPLSETEGRAVHWYNYKKYFPDASGSAKIEYQAKIDEKSGNIDAVYSRILYDNAGNVINSSMDIPTTWHISMINGRWDIVEIVEAP